MNAGRDVERLISDWLATEAPVRAPDRILTSAGSVIDRTQQRRFGAAWRESIMQLTLRRVIVPRPLVYLGLVALLILTLTAALLLVGASQRRLPAPFGLASNGSIAFDAGGDVYLAQPDGSAQQPVQGGLGDEFSPAFSTDGTKLAFWSRERPGLTAVQLFVGPADGSAPAVNVSPTVVMTGPDFVVPTWSPDGTRIAFSGYHRGSALHVANADGSRVVPLLKDPGIGFPAWSPDGAWIAFRNGDQNETRLEIVAPDGSQRRELEAVPGAVDAFTSITWSPDGSHIAYHRPGDQHAVAAITDLEGNETVLSDPAVHGERPAWSPDGQLLAYMSETLGVVVVNADGTNRRPLGKVASCSVSFSPDGKFLIGYEPEECFSEELVLIPLDNPGGFTRVRMPGKTVGGPGWQRVGG